MNSNLHFFQKPNELNHKKKISFWLMLLLFCLVFYNQYLGLNLVIFSFCLLLFGTYVLGKELLKFNTILVGLALIITSLSASWFGDDFSIFYTIFLMLLLAFIYFDTDEKIIFSLLKIGINFILIPFNFWRINPLNFSNSINFSIKKIVYYLGIPIGFLLIFIFLYGLINDDFKQIFITLSFDFINTKFIGTILLGTILLSYFWFYNTHLELNSPQINKFTEENFTQSSIEKFKEKTNTLQLNSGIIIFILLNLLLLLLLFKDFSQISNEQKFLEKLSFSQYVHQGVTAVIGSIILAISLILFYFKGNLMFSKNKTLLYLALFWLICNLILLFTTFYKNNIYINVYGLTLKRVGVIAFLLLTCIGLFITGIKMLKKKTNYFIFNKMAWVFILFFASICPINWSEIITKYNIERYKMGKINLDLDYLYHLSDYNYKSLKEFQDFHYINKNKNHILPIKENTYSDQEISLTDALKKKEQKIILHFNSHYDYRSTHFYYDDMSCTKK